MTSVVLLGLHADKILAFYFQVCFPDFLVIFCKLLHCNKFGFDIRSHGIILVKCLYF